MNTFLKLAVLYLAVGGAEFSDRNLYYTKNEKMSLHLNRKLIIKLRSRHDVSPSSEAIFKGRNF